MVCRFDRRTRKPRGTIHALVIKGVRAEP